MNLPGLNYDENMNFIGEGEFPYVWNKERLNIVNNFIKKINTINFEDFIIHTGIIRERNEGLLIWNGNQAIELDYTVDEYGHLPKDFCVLEEVKFGNKNIFINENYWFEIAHNNLVWLDLKEEEKIYKKILKNKEILKNNKQLFEHIEDISEITKYSTIKRNGKKYTLLYDKESENVSDIGKIIVHNCFEGIFLVLDYNKYLESHY